jgi:hypothetical protein
MQMAIVEFARNVLNIKNAGSSEFDKKCLSVVGLIEEWNKGGIIFKGTSTTDKHFLSNSLDPAFLIFKTFLANSTIAICIPKQIPKKGMSFFLA